jgi:hypothetical protein
MAGTSGYVGRFGDTLRKLTALNAAQGAFAPQQVGGADTAQAFSSAPPGVLEGAGAPQAPMPAQLDPTSGFSPAPAPAAPPADAGTPMDESGAGAIAQAPTSWKDFAKALPKHAKETIADHIEKTVGNLKQAYQHATQQEGVPTRPHASRGHMAMFLAEVALRAAANRGTSGSNGEALAKGVLQTQERRTALDTEAEDRQRKAAETARLETRADTTESTRHARDRGEKLADDQRNHEQALELERMRLAAEKSRAKGQNVKIVVDDQGNYQLIDLDTKQAVPVEEDVTTTTPVQGSRGKGTTGGKSVTTKKPVKALPKTNASGLDQDTVLNKIAATTKELRADRKLVRSLKEKFGGDLDKVDAEIKRRARTQVEGDVESLGGTGASREIDFNDL